MKKETKKKSGKNQKSIAKKSSQKSIQLDVFSEIVGMSIMGLAILIAVSLFTDKVGLVGDGIEIISLGFFGMGGYIIPFYMIYIGILYVRGKIDDILASVYQILPITLLMVTLFHLIHYGEQTEISLLSFYYIEQGSFLNGGWIGAAIAYLLLEFLGIWGSYILLIVLLGIWLLMITQFPIFSWVHHTMLSTSDYVREFLIESRTRYQEEKEQKQLKKSVVTTKMLKEKEKALPVEDHPPIYINHLEDVSYDFEQIDDFIEEVACTHFEEEHPIQKTAVNEELVEQSNTSAEVAMVDVNLENVDEIHYEFPSIELLAKSEGINSPKVTSRDSLASAKKLEDTLSSFGVEAKVTQINRGPTVTRYELQPKQGVKVSKIVNLADDIALNLAAAGIRIEAPIPGKAAVGIEVPNEKSEMVYLRDVISSDQFAAFPSKLAFALGRDIAGKPIVADIAKMPHMLIAGATGSGKSVCINTLIISILYKANPSEVKLIMIDPKVVELNVYNGIPHLLIPVVTDPKKAAGALGWAVNEMTKRYQLFAENNVRDMKGYNAKVTEDHLKMPSIIIIIDELADLMMTAAKEVEDAICRLAQMARAAGIHLVIATQRPSVDVITGVIKANIPSRLAFAVSSGIDSRTILDSNGAEKLLGKGDMLFCPIGESKPIRIQGAFISDKEVESIVEFVKQSGEAKYEESVIESISQPTIAIESSSEDELLPQAAQLIVGKEKISISMLQRHFRIGFNRASRLMEALEARGVVGPDEGSKPRRVLNTHFVEDEH